MLMLSLYTYFQIYLCRPSLTKWLWYRLTLFYPSQLPCVSTYMLAYTYVAGLSDRINTYATINKRKLSSFHASCPLPPELAILLFFIIMRASGISPSKFTAYNEEKKVSSSLIMGLHTCKNHLSWCRYKNNTLKP